MQAYLAERRDYALHKSMALLTSNQKVETLPQRRDYVRAP